MDVSALTERYGTIPHHLQEEANDIWAHLQQQSEHVISIKFTKNFGVDNENSKIFGSKVHKGLIVSLKPGYRISSEDSWLHPNLNQCRALYDGGLYTEISDLAPTNCSAGVYSVEKINSIGDLVATPHTVVDVHLKDAAAVRKNWNGETAESVYTTTLRDRTLEEVQDYATKLGAQNKIRADFTNILYRGRGEFHFYNNAYKEAGLVLVSPLIGYKLIQGKDHAADFLSTEVIDVKKLHPNQQKSLYSKAYWESCELINTFVTRKSFANIHADYRMQKGNFSATNITHHLTPTQILDLTPSAEHVPMERGIWEHYRTNELEIPLTKLTMQTLLDHRDNIHILNPKFYREGKLILPRNIVEQYLN